MALRKSLDGYGLATLAAIAAVAATVTTPLLQVRPYVFSFVAVVASAWFGGVRPALFCTVLSIASVAAARSLMLPTGFRLIDVIQAASFAAVAAIVASFARARTKSEIEARRHGAQLEAVFKQAGVGIAIVDRNGRIARANKRMADIIGRSPEETVGLLCESITHPDDWAANKESMRQVLSGSLPDFAVDARHLCPDNRVVWTHVSMSPLLDTDGRSEGLIVVVEDVTERRESEEALRLADRQKDDFLALLSHELRNPLAPIRTAVQLLQMRSNLDDDGRRLHGVIERQVQHLVRLVDDLLDVSRILRDKVALRPGPVEIADVIAIAVETARPLVDAQRQELSVALPSSPLCVHGDQVRLAQAIGNLLNNASKYTPRGGSITLTAREDPDELTLSVKDTGAGIPADVLPTIFEPFVQADRSLQRAQGGLGIGLTLVKKIVELHGGTVEASSAGAGQGSEFVVRLPRLHVPASPAEPAPSPRDEGEVARQRVLVVDDNVDAADSLSMLLTSMGHEVAVSRDGIDAVRRTWNWRPDIVLLDIGLPGMSGYEVANALRERENKPWLVAVTGYGQDSDRQRAIEAGFDDHLVKPVDVTRLEQALRQKATARTA